MVHEKVKITDYLKLTKLDDIRVTEDFIFWVEQTPTIEKDRYNSFISRFDVKTGERVKFTAGTKSDYYPRPSENEIKLAFISSRSKKPQIFVMNIDGGEGIKLTYIESGVLNFKWSPNSQKIAFQAKWKSGDRIESEQDKTIEENEIEDLKEKHEKNNIVDPRIVTNLIYKTGTSFIDHSRTTQLFVVDVESKKTIRISKPEFNYGPPTWLDDNTIICDVINDENPDLAIHHNIIKINLTDNSEDQVYKNYNPYIFLSEVFVNKFDNTNILVETLEEGYTPAKDSQIRKFGFIENGQINVINKNLDRGIVGVKFISKNEGLIQIDTDGYSRIVRYNKEGNKFEPIYEPKISIQSFDTKSEVEFYATATNPKHPSAVWKWTKEKGMELIYDPNTDYLAKSNISFPKEFWFTNPNGVKFQCWLMEANNTNEEKPPLILSIHGGPHAMWDNAGSMWHEWQTQVAMGYTVLACNPVGSDGYGEEFLRNVGARWGIDDARDLLLVVDELVEDGKVDPNNLFLTGGSYAGFQVANIITFDHRFNAGCAQRGVYNLTNLEAGSDLARFGISEYDGAVWDNLEKLWTHSPISKVRDIQTPLLIIHSENDFRVPISQADEMFSGMRVHGKTVKYVRYPRDGHELSRSGEPPHVIDRVEKMMEWFEEHKK